jgi:heptosyltransferase-2
MGFMHIVSCRHFNGYKPCGKSAVCDLSCGSLEIPQVRLLIIHLGALGAVVRATSVLAAIKRKFPSSHITWVTDAPAHRLLANHPRIDRVLTSSHEDLLQLRALEFDLSFVIDKSLKAAGIQTLVKSDWTYGFSVDSRTGAIVPATPAARELWELGLSDQKKFFENKKPETQLLIEALELGPFQRDEYELHLSATEKSEALLRRQQWMKDSTQPIIALNTGCSNVIAAKKWTVEFSRRVIQELSGAGYRNLVLLGGPEDTLRNQQIANQLPVISSPTELGLRDGLVSTEACDLIITGDSLGMHLGIAQRKYVIAWFGPTCAHEIDLYGRGEILLSAAQTEKSACGPCWKRSCDKSLMCFDRVDIKEVIAAVARGVANRREQTIDNQLGTQPVP